MAERSAKVKVVLLGGPHDSQDVYVDRNAILDKFVIVAGERYELIEGCDTCSEAFCFRWSSDRADRR